MRKPLFRIMVQGDDGYEFCYENDVPEDKAFDMVEAVARIYPEGYVFIEEQRENEDSM